MSLLLAACIVLGVHDGDTLTARCQGRARDLTVRVAEVDAPEYPAFTWGLQPGAVEARDLAVKLCPVGGATKLRLWKYDKRTSRWIAYVECNGMDLSTQLVARGAAWAYLPAKDSDIVALQKAAQDQRVGLWAPGNASVPPSQWRKGCRCQ